MSSRVRDRHRCTDDDSKLLHCPVILERGKYFIAGLVVTLLGVLVLDPNPIVCRLPDEPLAALDRESGNAGPGQGEVIRTEEEPPHESIHIGGHLEPLGSRGLGEHPGE